MTADTPLFRVRLKDDVAQVEGDTACRLGQVALPESLRTGQEIFGEWRWDGREVVLRTCRFGFFPLYYYATASEFGVSSSLQRLIECGAPADLDEVALATLLRLGWLVGNDTVFRAIKVVPPSGEVRWSGGIPTVAGGYTFPKPQHLSRGAAVEGFGELFRQAMRRRVARDLPVTLPLSGGRDSRHILLEMADIGCPPTVCITTHDFPPYREGNIRIAEMMCRRIGIPHQVVGQPASRLKTEVEKNRCTGFGAFEHAWWVNLFRAASRAAAIAYDGLAGDALSADGYLKEDQVALFERGEIAALAERIVDNWSWKIGEPTLARILSAEAARRFPRELAVRRVAEELSLHVAAANPLSSFNFWNRTRRCGALGPMAIAPYAAVTAITPYLDYDLFDFLASFPPHLLMDRTLHTETIHRMHPAHRDVPFSNEIRMPLHEGTWHQRRFLAEAGLFAAARSTGRLIRRGPTLRRLLALAGSGGSGLSKRAADWIAPLHVVYLAQLEKLCSDWHSGRRRGVLSDVPH